MKTDNGSQETLQIIASVNRKQIAYLNAILESYEGLAVMRTLQPEQGVVCFYVSRSLWKEGWALLLSLQEEVGIEFIQKPVSLT